MAALPYMRRGASQSRSAALTLAVFKDFRSWYMKRRRDWNRGAPPLPLWFRLALKRIDHRLVLQFIPPRTAERPDGVPSKWQDGAWYICASIPNSQWITRRAIFVLVDDNGRYLPPDRELIRVLRKARQARRRNQIDLLEKQYEESIDLLMKSREEKSRAELLDSIINTMRKRNMRSFGHQRVFIPSKTG